MEDKCMIIYGNDIDGVFVLIVLFLLAVLGSIYWGLETRSRGKRIERQKNEYNLLQSKAVIINATYLRSGNITPSFHFDRLREIVDTTANFSDNMKEAKKNTDQFEVRMKLISQLKKVSDELQTNNDSVFFDSLSRSEEEFLGSLEDYGIKNAEDVSQLYDWFWKAYYLKQKEEE